MFSKMSIEISEIEIISEKIKSACPEYKIKNIDFKITKHYDDYPGVSGYEHKFSSVEVTLDRK